MPELPEVETIRGLLEKQLVGRTIVDVEVLYERMIYGNRQLFSSIVGATMTSIKRKGKFLLIYFNNDTVLISHLRMEGKYYLYEESEESSRFARIIFHLDHNQKLCYDDSRKFGVMKVIPVTDLLKEPWLISLGPEPMELKDATSLYQKAKRCHKPIKVLIMDQTFLAGLGNIYADETLFAAHIHPETPANLLSLDEWESILSHARRILLRAIEAGGSTIRSYHAAREMDGMFQDELLVYGRKGDFCPNCHHAFDKIIVGGRGTTYCPKCQKNKDRPLVIGLTGVIGSGKSTALEILASLGAAVISCDTIVHSLYQDYKIQRHLEKLLKGRFFDGDAFSLTALRNDILNNPEHKKIVEDYLFPLVKRQLIDFIRSEHGSSIVVLEIPLLFEAHFDDLCDVTLAIKVSSNDQRSNLKKRGQEQIEAMIEMNYDGEHYPYASKLDYYLDTNNDEKTLQEALAKLYHQLVNRNAL